MKQLSGDSVETTREAPKYSFTIQHRLRLSQAMKGRKPWNKGLTKADPRVLKNIVATQSNPHLRGNLSKALMGHIPTFNRKHTKTTIEKMRKWSIGRKKWYPAWNKGLTAKTNTKLSSIGRNISKSLMKLPKEKRSEIGRKARSMLKPIRVSRQERIVANELASRGAKVKTQYKIENKNILTYVDLFFPDSNTCVFLDGIYWHSRKEVVKRDIRTTCELENMGYVVKRFTLTRDNEQDIVKNILDGDIVRHSK